MAFKKWKRSHQSQKQMNRGRNNFSLMPLPFLCMPFWRGVGVLITPSHPHPHPTENQGWSTHFASQHSVREGWSTIGRVWWDVVACTSKNLFFLFYCAENVAWQHSQSVRLHWIVCNGRLNRPTLNKLINPTSLLIFFHFWNIIIKIHYIIQYHLYIFCNNGLLLEGVFFLQSTRTNFIDFFFALKCRCQ